MPSGSDEKEFRVPLSAEHLNITRRKVVTGHVKVSVVTKERKEAINELLMDEHAEIERVRIGKEIDEVPSVRREGDTVVIPVVEEMLVLKRRLVLKEEVRVRLVRTENRHCEETTLREQDVIIEQSPATQAAEADLQADETQRNRNHG